MFIFGIALCALALARDILMDPSRVLARSHLEQDVLKCLKHVTANNIAITACDLTVVVAESTDRPKLRVKQVRKVLLDAAARGLVIHRECGYYGERPEHDTFIIA